jgi:hypothetical protein
MSNATAQAAYAVGTGDDDGHPTYTLSYQPRFTISVERTS